MNSESNKIKEHNAKRVVIDSDLDLERRIRACSSPSYTYNHFIAGQELGSQVSAERTDEQLKKMDEGLYDEVNDMIELAKSEERIQRERNLMLLRIAT